MKKSILLAVLALALPASAASIDWTMNTAAASNYMVGSDGKKLTGVAYLMLTDSLTDEVLATFKTQDAIQEQALGKAGVTITDGINKATTTTTDSRLSAPYSYSFTVLIYDTVNNEYFKSSTFKEQTAYNLSGDDYTDPKAISFNAQQLYATSTLRGTQTYVSVPEPSTAALALAGLALLLKRRKA